MFNVGDYITFTWVLEFLYKYKHRLSSVHQIVEIQKPYIVVRSTADPRTTSKLSTVGAVRVVLTFVGWQPLDDVWKDSTE